MDRRRFLGAVLLGMMLGGLARAQERAGKPAFKGMELYSWEGAQGWSYALLDGTNRNKTWDEIKAAAIGETALRQRLATLAVGEYLSWINRCQGASKGALSYPPETTLSEIRQLCERLEIKLFVDKR